MAKIFTHPTPLLDLFKRHGISLYKPSADRAAYEWDGERMAENVPSDVLLHNLCHWLVAPKERRVMPEFGLGSPPLTIGEFPLKDILSALHPTDRQHEEDLVCTLGMVFADFLVMLPGCNEPLKYSLIARYKAELRDKGLITEHHEPSLLALGMQAVS